MNSRFLYFLIVILAFKKGCNCLKDVYLDASSWQVPLQKDITMRCHYDLEGANLQSVKWYRGYHEFYRYDPNASPTTKTFPFPSSNITAVDLTGSNQTQVTVREVNVDFNGNVTCEVTTETYRMVKAHAKILVTFPPKKKPVIWTNKNKYAINDTLIANCSSSLSYPPSSLSFLLNNEPVGTPSKEIIYCNHTFHPFPTVQCEDNDNRTSWTMLPLNITLDKKYFHDNEPKFILRCIAVVQNTDHRTSSEKIVPLINQPKPERVIHNSSRTIFFINYHVLFLLIFLRAKFGI